MNNERILSHQVANVLSIDELKNVASGSMSITQTQHGSHSSMSGTSDTTTDFNADW